LIACGVHRITGAQFDHARLPDNSAIATQAMPRRDHDGLAIIGLITAASASASTRSSATPNLKTTHIQLLRIVGDATQYMLMKNKCPTVDDLVTEQYLPQPPRDAWGTPIVMKCPGDHEPDPVDVISWGPDLQRSLVEPTALLQPVCRVLF
jgi:hypothetical protein